MTDLYDISANPKDAIDRERVREALKEIRAMATAFPRGNIAIVTEAATAWLATADGMPEENPALHSMDANNIVSVATVKKLMRITE